MKLLIAFVTGTVFSLVTVCGADNAAPRPVTIVTRSFSRFLYTDDGMRIVLGRITQVSTSDEHKYPVRVIYKAVVIAEFRRRMSEGNFIEISGLDEGSSSSWNGFRSDFNVGDTFVMAVYVTKDKSHFTSLNQADLPIGMSIPCKVQKKQVAALKAGLLLFGTVMEKPDSMIKPEEAKLLIDNSGGNFFIWAIGVAGLSLDGTQNDVNQVTSLYGKTETSNCQAIWIDHCLGTLFPDEIRPAMDARHRALIAYLSAHADLVPPG